MIYIISVDSDSSTSLVLEWLNKEDASFLRINNIIDAKKNVQFLPVEILNSTENKTTNKTPHPTIWFRKLRNFEDISDKTLKEYYKEESISLVEFLLQNNDFSKKNIGLSIFGIKNNKLEILKAAKESGLIIPETLITNSKSDLLRFYSLHKRVIAKPISEVLISEANGKLMITYTKLIGKKFIMSLPNFFPTSLFQQYISKEFDIRIFYLDGKLYPMSIFSQESKRTKIDVRKYNFTKPNRCIPFKLPKDVEDKLLQFLKKYKYEVASVDMVKCRDTGRYYFLEVNPYGQFEMVSTICNYYLEKKIASLLCEI